MLSTRLAPMIDPHSTGDYSLDRILFLLLALGFLLRLTCMFELAGNYPLYFHPPKASDMAVYQTMAENLKSGIPSDRPLFWNPLYYHILALIYAISGSNKIALVLLQIFAGTLAIYLTYQLGCILHGRRVGHIAALITAIYKPFIMFEQFQLIESIQMTAFLIFTVVYLRNEGRSRYMAFFLGGLFGITVLFRSNILAFLPFLLLWSFRFGRITSSKKAKIAWNSIFLCGLVLAIAPLTIRNFVISGEFVPFSTNSGETFFLGNYKGASGIQAFPENFKAMQSDVEDLSPGALQRFWVDRTVASYKGNFRSYPLLLLKKIGLFWGAWEIPNNISLQILERFSTILSLPLPGYNPTGFLALSAICCLLVGRSLQRGHILLLFLFGSYTISVLVLMIHGRFRLIIYPSIIVFAAYAIEQIWLSRSDRLELVKWLFVTLGSALIVNIILNYNEFLNPPLFGFPPWVHY